MGRFFGPRGVGPFPPFAYAERVRGEYSSLSSVMLT